MAQIVKKTNKNGKISFVFRVSDGYDIHGKQRKQSMTWTPPADLTPKKAERMAVLEAAKFEQKVLDGLAQQNSMRFADFTDKWMNEYVKIHCKKKTVENFQYLLPRINEGLGHIQLKKLRTSHINSFYSSLAQDGAKTKKFVASADVRTLITQKMSIRKFCETKKISRSTLEKVFQGKIVSSDTVDKISDALGVSRSKIFTELNENTKLSAQSIRTYHGVVNNILSKAVKWEYIEKNPAENAELPRVNNNEAPYLDEKQARKLLILLQNETIKYRCPIIFALLSGLRRGELLGLRWTDVDFEGRTIQISQTSTISGKGGVYTDTPKTSTSSRTVRLAQSAFSLLEEYKDWQDEQKELCGDSWKNPDERIFTNEEGKPLHPNSLTGWFRNFAKDNGFPGIHVHSLRHSYASLMIAEGVPLVVVSKRLGHARTSTTANIYAHVITSADEKAAEVTECFADLITTKERKEQLA